MGWVLPTIPASSTQPSWTLHCTYLGLLFYSSNVPQSLASNLPPYCFFNPRYDLFLFLGANSHTFSSSLVNTSFKAFHEAWSRRAPLQSVPKALSALFTPFLWNYQFSVFTTRRSAPLGKELTVMLSARLFGTKRTGSITFGFMDWKKEQKQEREWNHTYGSCCRKAADLSGK